MAGTSIFAVRMRNDPPTFQYAKALTLNPDLAEFTRSWIGILTQVTFTRETFYDPTSRWSSHRPRRL
jgi:hypothetical protein